MQFTVDQLVLINSSIQKRNHLVSKIQLKSIIILQCKHSAHIEFKQVVSLKNGFLFLMKIQQYEIQQKLLICCIVLQPSIF